MGRESRRGPRGYPRLQRRGGGKRLGASVLCKERCMYRLPPTSHPAAPAQPAARRERSKRSMFWLVAPRCPVAPVLPTSALPCLPLQRAASGWRTCWWRTACAASTLWLRRSCGAWASAASWKPGVSTVHVQTSSVDLHGVGSPQKVPFLHVPPWPPDRRSPQVPSLQGGIWTQRRLPTRACWPCCACRATLPPRLLTAPACRDPCLPGCREEALATAAAHGTDPDGFNFAEENAAEHV